LPKRKQNHVNLNIGNSSTADHVQKNKDRVDSTITTK